MWIIFKYKGNYKLTVYADGFKSASVEFTVTKERVFHLKDEMGIAQYSFDGISTASVGSAAAAAPAKAILAVWLFLQIWYLIRICL